MRAVFRNGVIYPTEPVPPGLADGQEVDVMWDLEQPSDDPAEIQHWDTQWRQAGPLRYEAGERERVRAAMAEAEALAKAAVRRQMEGGL